MTRLITYLGDYAAVHVQANCQSNMVDVRSTGNVFTNLGLGGSVLASQIEGDQTCAAAVAQGTIPNFTSTERRDSGEAVPDLDRARARPGTDQFGHRT